MGMAFPLWPQQYKLLYFLHWVIIIMVNIPHSYFIIAGTNPIMPNHAHDCISHTIHQPDAEHPNYIFWILDSHQKDGSFVHVANTAIAEAAVLICFSMHIIILFPMKQRPFLRSSRPHPLQKVYLQVVAEPPRWFTYLGSGVCKLVQPSSAAVERVFFLIPPKIILIGKNLHCSSLSTMLQYNHGKTEDTFL